jgi:hypothetical protein
MDEISVPLVDTDGNIMPGTFQFDRCAKRCSLMLIWEGHELRADAGDFFECLCDIRRSLESQGLRPKCYGASLSAYPSGMCRSMGRGLKIYRNQMGKRAFRADLVSTFAVADDVEPATVEDQWRFHLEWLGSLGFHYRPTADGR